MSTVEGEYIVTGFQIRCSTPVTWKLQFVPGRTIDGTVEQPYSYPPDFQGGFVRFGPMRVSDTGDAFITANNSYGSAGVYPIHIIVAPPTAPSFTGPTALQPKSISVRLGELASLVGQAAGGLSYQWRKDGAEIPGATNQYLTFPKVQAGDAGSYTLVAANKYGSAISDAAVLTVILPATAPVITKQPEDQTVVEGATARLEVTASSTAPLSYQWRFNGANLLAATRDNLVVLAGASAPPGLFDVVVTNPAGSVTSKGVRITVIQRPMIAKMPAAQTLLLGTTTTFSASATGTAPITYQWRKDGVAIAGATASSLNIPSARVADAGSYSVVATNAAGSVTSSATTLSVDVPGRLINLSILAALRAEEDGFALGVAIGGAATRGTKPLLLRASGPSLAQFGITDFLADPLVELHSGGGKIAENDDWSGSAAISAAATQVGAFAFTGASSKDAAIFTSSLQPGPSSMRVTGRGSGSGAVLAELYDASASESLTIETPRIVNMSVLKAIAPTLTAGFVIGGSTEMTVLVRVIGPSLAPFGVTNFVTDPRVAILKADQTMAASNDDWAGTAALADVFAKVGAFPLPNTSKDAAVLVRLSPGSYTVQVSGGGAAGTALVEIYEVP